MILELFIMSKGMRQDRRLVTNEVSLEICVGYEWHDVESG